MNNIIVEHFQLNKSDKNSYQRYVSYKRTKLVLLVMTIGILYFFFVNKNPLLK